MTDVSAFPTITNVLVRGDNIISCLAKGTIKAGQVVCVADAGAATGLHPEVYAGNTNIGSPVGVALYGASTGEYVAVAGNGCWAYVAQADDTATIDAGHSVVANDNAVLGTVSEYDPAILSHAADAKTAAYYVLGKLMTDCAASGTAVLEINITPLMTASS